MLSIRLVLKSRSPNGCKYGGGNALQVQLQLQEDVRRAQARVDEREQRILELERNAYTLTTSRDELKHRVIKLEDYMATLPTNEEFTERTDEVAQCQQENDLLRIRIEEAEAEVAKLTQARSYMHCTRHTLAHTRTHTPHAHAPGISRIFLLQLHVGMQL